MCVSAPKDIEFKLGIGYMMKFNKLTQIAEDPARADQSAVMGIPRAGDHQGPPHRPSSTLAPTELMGFS